jgi:hypothetical protein
MLFWKSSLPSTEYDRLASLPGTPACCTIKTEKEGYAMKFILKVLFAPIIAVLAGFIWLCALSLRMSAWVFGIVSTILGILGLAVLLLVSVTNGIIVLVIAFLVSPVGLPMVAAWMIGQMQRFRYFIQDTVYG